MVPGLNGKFRKYKVIKICHLNPEPLANLREVKNGKQIFK